VLWQRLPAFVSAPVPGTEKSLLASGEFYPKGISADDERLRYFARVARELSATARLVFLMFNNCRAGHVMRNAMEMARLV